MIITTPLKVLLAVITIIALNIGLTSSLFAQTSSEASIVNAAKALGLTARPVEVLTRTPQNNHQANQARQHQANLKRQALQKQRQSQKADPYAAKRQQILRQNAERRKAHHKRIANIQKQKNKKAKA